MSVRLHSLQVPLGVCVCVCVCVVWFESTLRLHLVVTRNEQSIFGHMWAAAIPQNLWHIAD